MRKSGSISCLENTMASSLMHLATNQHLLFVAVDAKTTLIFFMHDLQFSHVCGPLDSVVSRCKLTSEMMVLLRVMSVVVEEFKYQSMEMYQLS